MKATVSATLCASLMAFALLAGCAGAQSGGASSGSTPGSGGSASAASSTHGASSPSAYTSSSNSSPASSSASASVSSGSSNPAATDRGITLQDAERIALEQVGIAYYGVAFTQEEEIDVNGAKSYAIGFVTSADEQYDFVIDATNGAVLSMQQSAGQAPEELKNAAAQAANPTRYVGEDEAVSIACADASVARSDIADLSITRTSVNGAAVHAIDFSAAGTKYHYDIDVREGRIINSSIE